MSRTPRQTKKAQDKTRYALRTGKIHLPDVCVFCRKPGCEETHHEHYGEPPKIYRCHKSCHVAYHNQQRRQEISVKVDMPTGSRAG